MLYYNMSMRIQERISKATYIASYAMCSCMYMNNICIYTYMNTCTVLHLLKDNTIAVLRAINNAQQPKLIEPQNI